MEKRLRVEVRLAAGMDDGVAQRGGWEAVPHGSEPGQTGVCLMNLGGRFRAFILMRAFLA